MMIGTKKIAQQSDYQTTSPQKSDRMYQVPDYQLITYTSPEVGKIANEILARAIKEKWPMPSDLPFTADGKKYMAQYQIHGKNRDHAGDHRGVAIYEQSGQNLVSNKNKPSNHVSQLDDAFFIKLNEMCGRLGVNPKDMLAIMQLESGLNPHAVNPKYSARGLNQITWTTLKGLGWKGNDREEFGKMSAEEQLPWVEKYFRSVIDHSGKGGNLNSAALLYVANFWPAALRNPAVRQGDPSAVIITEAGNPKEYAANLGLDADKDGKITYGDFIHLMKYDQKVLEHNGIYARLDQAVGNTPTQSQPSNIGNSPVDQMLADIKKALESAASKQSSFSIIVKADDFSTKLEYARILSSALKEELIMHTRTYTNENEVEVRCEDPASFAMIKAVSNDVAHMFNQATNNIVSTVIIKANKTEYQELDLKTAELHHRKFRLHLYGKKNS